MFGSTVLDNYFSSTNKVIKEEQINNQPKVNVSVMYPYEVSTCIDPTDIDTQMDKIKSKGILNESAMKFIKR